jgi:hypothetical protein
MCKMCNGRALAHPLNHVEATTEIGDEGADDNDMGHLIFHNRDDVTHDDCRALEWVVKEVD